MCILRSAVALALVCFVLSGCGSVTPHAPAANKPAGAISLVERKPLVIAGGQVEQLQPGDNAVLVASTSSSPSLDCPIGTTPSSPVNGWLWCVANGPQMQVGGSSWAFVLGGGSAPSSGLCPGYTGTGWQTSPVTCQYTAFTTSAAGLVPTSPGGTADFLRADGAWAAPSGGGGTGTTIAAGTNVTVTPSSGSSCVTGTTPTCTIAASGGSGGSGGLFSGSLGAPLTLSSGGFSSGNWINQRGSVINNVSNGVQIISPSAGAADNASLFCKAMPSTPFTLLYSISAPITTAGQFPVSGMALQNASTGAFVVFGLQQRQTAGTIPPIYTYLVAAYTSPSSNTTVISTADTNSPQIAWLQIVNDGTNLTMSMSFDGVQFTASPYEVYNMSSGVFSGGLPDQECIMTDPVNGGMSSVVMSLSD